VDDAVPVEIGDERGEMPGNAHTVRDLAAAPDQIVAKRGSGHVRRDDEWLTAAAHSDLHELGNARVAQGVQHDSGLSHALAESLRVGGDFDHLDRHQLRVIVGSDSQVNDSVRPAPDWPYEPRGWFVVYRRAQTRRKRKA
jgi:hypothetical protein